MSIVENKIISKLLLGTIFLGIVSCGKSEEGASSAAPPPLEIAVGEVVHRDVPRTMEFVGQTKGAVDAEVRARVEGVILGIHFDEGREVTEGQLLYTIDPAPFEAKLAQAKAALSEAEAKLVKAESDLKRMRPLAQMNAVSKKDLDTSIALEGTARGGVEAAQAVVKSAEIELGYTKVNAPVSGVIGLSKVKVGELVGQGPANVVLTNVSKLDPIHVRFSVNEKDYLYLSRLRQQEVKSGQPIVKRVLDLQLADNSIHPEKGEVVSSEAQVDAATGSLTVEASFPNPGKILRPGQFAKIKTVGETVSGALLIPKRAIKELQGQYQVFVVGADNIVEQRNIKLGAAIDNLQIVEDGLKDKERVALDGVQRLKSGMTITPKLETSIQ